MSETPEQYGDAPAHQQTLSAEERLHCLKDIRWALQHIEAHAVAPANYTQFHHEVILQAIQSVRPSLQALFEDASKAE